MEAYGLKRCEVNFVRAAKDDGAQPHPAAEDPDAFTDLFRAFQQQLGLKLNSTKAPVDVLVIDHLAKPSAN